jgi:membrane-associated phospholipid phosphatase
MQFGSRLKALRIKPELLGLLRLKKGVGGRTTHLSRIRVQTLTLPPVLILTLTLCFGFSSAFSAEVERAPELDWRKESLVLGLGLGAQGFGQWKISSLPKHDPESVSRGDLWAWDRRFAGTYSQSYARFSDVSVTMAWAPALTVDFLLWKTGKSEAGWMLADGLWLGEASLFASGLNLWVRSWRVHPRPLTFSDQASFSEKTAPEAGGSFYSGHATQGFLAASFFTESMRIRHRDADWFLPVSLLAYAAAMGAASGRVLAGKHYPSDVIVGATLGTMLGWGMAHYRNRSHQEKSLGNWEGHADEGGWALRRVWVIR